MLSGRRQGVLHKDTYLAGEDEPRGHAMRRRNLTIDDSKVKICWMSVGVAGDLEPGINLCGWDGGQLTS